jgi:hypothetical protein
VSQTIGGSGLSGTSPPAVLQVVQDFAAVEAGTTGAGE